jgi:hypothetical protein
MVMACARVGDSSCSELARLHSNIEIDCALNSPAHCTDRMVSTRTNSLPGSSLSVAVAQSRFATACGENESACAAASERRRRSNTGRISTPKLAKDQRVMAIPCGRHFSRVTAALVWQKFSKNQGPIIVAAFTDYTADS